MPTARLCPVQNVARQEAIQKELESVGEDMDRMAEVRGRGWCGERVSGRERAVPSPCQPGWHASVYNTALHQHWIEHITDDEVHAGGCKSAVAGRWAELGRGGHHEKVRCQPTQPCRPPFLLSSPACSCWTSCRS